MDNILDNIYKFPDRNFGDLTNLITKVTGENSFQIDIIQKFPEYRQWNLSIQFNIRAEMVFDINTPTQFGAHNPTIFNQHIFNIKGNFKDN